MTTSPIAALAGRAGTGAPAPHWRGGTLARHLAITAAVAVTLALATYQLDSFRDYQLATAAAYLCATAGMTVLIGRSGQLSLGHGAFMATGAYTVAFVQNALSEHGLTGSWTLSVSLPLGVLAATVAGTVIGLAAARLRGPYLAGVTLAVAVVVPAITTTLDDIFNGDQGLPVYVDPPPAALGPDFRTEQWQAWLALGGALLTMLLLANLVHSRFDRAFRAVRDDEVAASLAGIHVARTQVLAFVVSAACAGLSGGLFAILALSVSPSAFSLTLSLFLLLAVVIGGLGTLPGAVWGAVLLVVLPDLAESLADQLTLPPAAAQRIAGNLPLAIYGLMLVVVMIAAPGGIQGLVRRAVRAGRVRRTRYAAPNLVTPKRRAASDVISPKRRGAADLISPKRGAVSGVISSKRRAASDSSNSKGGTVPATPASATRDFQPEKGQR